MTNNGTQPIYFYSTAKDYCAARDFSFTAPGNTDHGDLCAYIDRAPSRGLWACPAGDKKCWTIAKPCGGDQPRTPGDNQTLCTLDSVKWCCNDSWESCSTNSSNTGTCLAKTFDNPIADLAPSLASSIAEQAVLAGATGVMLSVPTALSSKPSTTDLSGASGINSAPTSVTTAGGKSSLLTSAFAPTTTSGTKTKGGKTTGTTTDGSSGSSGTAASSSATATMVNSEPAMPSDKLSKGAIAGIAVAAVSVVLLICLVAFFIYKRRQRASRAGAAELPSDDSHHAALVSGVLSPASAGAGVVAGVVSSEEEILSRSELSPDTGLQEMRDPETVVSPPSHEVPNPLDSVISHNAESPTMVSAMEPSPLQTLMIHGVYPRPP